MTKVHKVKFPLGFWDLPLSDGLGQCQLLDDSVRRDVVDRVIDGMRPSFGCTWVAEASRAIVRPAIPTFCVPLQSPQHIPQPSHSQLTTVSLRSLPFNRRSIAFVMTDPVLRSPPKVK